MMGIKVKPLQWHQRNAKTPFGAYEIIDVTERGLGFAIRRPDGSEKCFIGDEHKARKVCWDDFKRRILSMVVSQP